MVVIVSKFFLLRFIVICLKESVYNELSWMNVIYEKFNIVFEVEFGLKVFLKY